MPGASMIDPNLPFIDLHRHLDGSFRLETILELARQHNIELPGATVEGMKRTVPWLVEKLREEAVVTAPTA